MKKTLLRFAAGILASLLLVGLVAVTDHSATGSRTDGLYYEVTGIHPDAILMQVNGMPITAEEYLYCLAYDCEYLSSYVGDIDWSDTLNDNMTYGEYAKLDSLETVKQFAVIRAWAKESGISLSEDSQAALDAQAEQYASYYGGEDAFAQQVAYQGVSQECYNDIAAMGYLYSDLHNAFCDKNSPIHPSDDEIANFADENHYISFKALSWPADATGANTAAKNASRTLKHAKDLNAAYMDLAQDIGLDTDGSATTATAADLGDALYDAISNLEIGGVSDAVKIDGMYYVLIHCKLNTRDLVSLYFDTQVKDKCNSATVTYPASLYSKINTADFYTKLQQSRAALAKENSGK